MKRYLSILFISFLKYSVFLLAAVGIYVIAVMGYVQYHTASEFFEGDDVITVARVAVATSVAPELLYRVKDTEVKLQAAEDAIAREKVLQKELLAENTKLRHQLAVKQADTALAEATEKQAALVQAYVKAYPSGITEQVSDTFHSVVGKVRAWF